MPPPITAIRWRRAATGIGFAWDGRSSSSFDLDCATVGHQLLGILEEMIEAGRFESGHLGQVVPTPKLHGPFAERISLELARLLRVVGAVFAIYLADSIGYTGSVAVQLARDLAVGESSRLEFLQSFSVFMSLFGALSLGAAWYYFLGTTRTREPTVDAAATADSMADVRI